MSYQWYKTSKPDNNGELISGATSSTYTPSTLGVGTVYYYAIVTNTNNNANSSKVASIKSNMAKIIINVPDGHYPISFYNKGLDFLETIYVQEGIIDPSNIKSGIWYKANETSALINHNLSESIVFYATSNVQEITNQDELNNVRNNLNGKYILFNDIFLDDTKAGFENNKGWKPIGSNGNSFSGIFNGNNHTITNLWINRPSDNHIGFFGYGYDAKIKNIRVETANGKEVKGYGSVGIIIGGLHSSTIKNSYANGNLSGAYDVGGIAGALINSYIRNSYSMGNIRGNDYFIGGITGRLDYHSTIENSYFNGNVSGNSDNVGGITGAIYYDSTIKNSYSMGNVSGKNFVGGIVGFLETYSTIQNSAAISATVNGKNSNVNRVIGCSGCTTTSNNFALNSMMVNDNTVTGGSADNAKGLSKTDAELKEQATYVEYIERGGLGWKFGNNDDNPWKIDPSKNNGYPYFYWQE